MKEGPRPEDRFRRMAVTAIVVVWVGIILFTVGLVFSSEGAKPRSAAQAVALGPAAVLVVTTEAVPTATRTATSDPTATETATPTPIVPTSTPIPSVTATEMPVPTDTSTPTPIPTPTPTPVFKPPTRIVAPAIGMDAPVVEVGWHQEVIEGETMVVWDAADYAAGWNKTSARPGGGGNIVISGHHNIKGEVFRYIVDLKPGDEITLYVEDKPYTYYVAQTMILPEKGQPLETRRENARWIMPTVDERVTLVTCWPYTNNTHRVIVVAAPMPGATVSAPAG